MGHTPWGLVGEWVIPQEFYDGNGSYPKGFDRGMGHILRGLIGEWVVS